MMMDYKTAAVGRTEEFLKDLGTNTKGLTEVQAQEFLSRFGKNRIKRKSETVFSLFLRQLTSPFIYLLFAASVISFALGESIEGGMILFFVIVNTLLGFWQEFKSHQALKVLKTYLMSKTRVFRENKKILVNAEEIVPGDILLLEAGDKIPADIRFLECSNLTVDESILTGESDSVVKSSGKLSAVKDFFSAKNIGFSGTLILTGSGKAAVIATGSRSQLGNISEKVLSIKSRSAFTAGISKISSFILKLTVVTIVFVFLLNLIFKGKSFDPVSFVIFGIALSVGAIPEVLPLVITMSLSSGAINLARKKVIPKRLTAIEDLGSIDILATDKTGTITENKLEIIDISSTDPKKTLIYALLASSFLEEEEERHFFSNAFDLAISQKLEKSNLQEIAKTKVASHTPFDAERRLSSSVVRINDETFEIIRGAPEKICDYDKETLLWLEKQGKLGRRILTVVVKKEGGDKNNFIGSIAFFDPLKKTAKSALLSAEKLGVQVKMLTGDSLEVARSVALEIGLIEKKDQSMLGEDFDRLEEKEKEEAVEKIHVFARTTPQQKYEIIKKLKEKGFTVGFLGEGFNDGPALELSHVGLVVSHASDVAKNAADIILLNKDLHAIILGIKEGRKIFANTVKYIKSTLTSNFGNFYALAISTLFLKYLPMLPSQILLVNLLSDFPMISIAKDTVDERELLRPKTYKVAEIAFFATVMGFVSTIFDFVFFAYLSRFGEKILQTGWFMASILTELAVFYVIRTHRLFFKAKFPSFIILLTTFLAGALTIIIPQTSFGKDFFQFVSLPAINLATIFVLTALYFILSETVKIFFYKSNSLQKANG